MKKLFTQVFKNKRGSEVMQVLIVMALLGAVAVGVLGGLGDKLKEKNTDLLNGIDTNVQFVP